MHHDRRIVAPCPSCGGEMEHRGDRSRRSRWSCTVCPLIVPSRFIRPPDEDDDPRGFGS